MAEQRRSVVDDVTLCNAWIDGVNAGKRAAEIAKALGLKKESLTQRVSSLRSDGVPLPELPRGGGRKRDIEGLQKLLADKIKVPLKDIKAKGQALVDAAKKRAEERAAEDTEVPAE